MARDANAITYVRGDSYSKTITIMNSSTELPVNLLGCAAKMTVATIVNPPDETTKLFSLDGVIDADPTTGVITFTPSVANNAVIGNYFYDVQITDGDGNVRTPIKSTYTITQDITK